MAALGAVLGLFGGLGLLSNMTVGPGPSYGSSDAGGLLNCLIISWDKPIGLFGTEELDDVEACLADDWGPVRALADDGVVPGRVGFDWRACGPFRDLADILLGVEVLGVEKNVSDVWTIGENLIFLVSLQVSFSCSSSSEL